MPDRTSQDVTKHNKEKAIYVLISSYYYGRRAPLRKTPPEIPDEILGGWSATRKLSRNRLLGNRSSLVANGRLTRSRLGSPSVSTANSPLRRQGGPIRRLVVRRAVINNYRRNSGVDVATGAPHSSQNLASGETRWPFRQRLLSSQRST
jgi:hypothetical protein